MNISERRLSATRLLFGIGLALYLVGYFFQFWILKSVQRGAAVAEWPLKNGALCLLLMAPVCWVIAPFLSRYSLWMKIVLSVGLVIAWTFVGDALASTINHALGLAHT
jgi:hypothetical protein